MKDVIDGVDLSRTLGWFSTIFPIILEAASDGDCRDTLESVKRQLRAIPNHGIGYGVLKYLSPKQRIRRALISLPKPEISFNYLGQFDRVLTSRSPFVVAEEPSGTYRCQRARRTHLVEVIGSVLNGQLQVDWIYSTNKHNPKTIERLARHYVEALSSILDYCLATKADAVRLNQIV